MRSVHAFLELDTGAGINLHDITPRLRELAKSEGIAEGTLTVTSHHTTTAVVINEHEERLLADIRACLERLVPPGGGYLHDDIHLRDCPPDEPENAHAHIMALLLGSSESIAVAGGAPVLGRWQSVMLVELDGPRHRKVSVQLTGSG